MAKKRNNLRRLPPKKSKKFKIDIQPQEKDFDNLPPAFSLKHIQYGGESCISNCHNNDRSAILNKLLRLSQFFWKQIASKPKTGLGYEAIPHYRFKRSIPPIVTPEVDILVFRYSDSGRIAGFRKDDIYNIIMVGDDLYSH